MIAIDKNEIETSAEEKVLLAEEMAHLQLGATYHIEIEYNAPAHRMLRRKQEIRAKRQAIKRLLPIDTIKDYLNKSANCIYEMADELALPEDFLVYTIDYYISSNKLNCSDFELSQDDKSA